MLPLLGSRLACTGGGVERRGKPCLHRGLEPADSGSPELSCGFADGGILRRSASCRMGILCAATGNALLCLYIP